MVALVLELAIASGVAYAVWANGHPVWAVVAFLGVMGLSNSSRR